MCCKGGRLSYGYCHLVIGPLLQLVKYISKPIDSNLHCECDTGNLESIGLNNLKLLQW